MRHALERNETQTRHLRNARSSSWNSDGSFWADKYSDFDESSRNNHASHSAWVATAYKPAAVDESRSAMDESLAKVKDCSATFDANSAGDGSSDRTATRNHAACSDGTAIPNSATAEKVNFSGEKLRVTNTYATNGLDSRHGDDPNANLTLGRRRSGSVAKREKTSGFDAICAIAVDRD